MPRARCSPISTATATWTAREFRGWRMRFFLDDSHGCFKAMPAASFNAGLAVRQLPGGH